MTDQPHTPTTTDILGTYIRHMTRHGDVSVEEVRSEFFRWLTTHDESIREEEREDIAAAEQRGAERAYDETVEEIASMEGNRMIIARYKHLNPYRADRIANKEANDE